MGEGMGPVVEQERWQERADSRRYETSQLCALAGVREVRWVEMTGERWNLPEAEV